MTERLSREEHERISGAIRSAEANTSGEIYCVVARASDSYFFPSALFATIGVLVASFAAAWAAHALWIDIAPTTFVAAQLVAAASVLAVLWGAPGLRIHFVPRRQRYRHAHDNALKQFLARNVHITERRTGVLIFVSLAERYAEIVADAGIDAKVSQQGWNAIVAGLTEHARDRQLAAGLLGAVEAVGALLSVHFPVVGTDLNELDDHVVEL